MVPTLVELARPLPPLTYLAPEGLRPGVRVRVRVRNSLTWGVVLGPDPRPPLAKLRPVEAVLDPFPLLPPRLQELLAFAAGYYGCGLAHLMALCLPQAVQADWQTPVSGAELLGTLREAGEWPRLMELGDAWHRGELELPSLFHRRELRGAGLTEVCRTSVPHPVKVNATQGRVLAALEEAGGALLETELLQSAKVSASVLGTLEKHGLIERVRRLDLMSQKREDLVHKRVVLNEEQRKAAEAVGLDDFAVHLLFGVTGSGKTEVYLELAERVLAAGRRVLWLVPEIGLTPRLLARLEARFPGRVAVGHAGLNATEKQADVVRLLKDEGPLFLGVRNAVLAPLRNLGLIVVDEEQESSYKSEEHPRIHARDLAIKRGQLEGCPVVLGSATPSLESWQAAQSGRYRLLQLTRAPRRQRHARGAGGGPAGVLQAGPQEGRVLAPAAEGHRGHPGAGRAGDAAPEPAGLRELLDVPRLRPDPGLPALLGEPHLPQGRLPAALPSLRLGDGAAGGLHPLRRPSTCGAWARARNRSRTSWRASSRRPASCAWTATPPSAAAPWRQACWRRRRARWTSSWAPRCWPRATTSRSSPWWASSTPTWA